MMFPARSPKLVPYPVMPAVKLLWRFTESLNSSTPMFPICAKSRPENDHLPVEPFDDLIHDGSKDKVPDKHWILTFFLWK